MLVKLIERALEVWLQVDLVTVVGRRVGGWERRLFG